MLCDLLHGGDAPIVVTGAIRPASAAGADGPANLLDAVRAAGARGDRRRSARSWRSPASCTPRSAVRKADSVSPRAFASPRSGALGRVSEERVEVWAGTRAAPAAAGRAPRRARRGRARRAGERRRAARGRARGRGRRARRRAARRRARAAGVPRGCRAAAARVPVVACVRPESGRILRGTYGFEGAERDVRAAGLILAPALSPGRRADHAHGVPRRRLQPRRDGGRLRALRSLVATRGARRVHTRSRVVARTFTKSLHLQRILVSDDANGSRDDQPGRPALPLVRLRRRASSASSTPSACPSARRRPRRSTRSRSGAAWTS